MTGFFRRLGHRAAPGVRKGRWWWESLTGTEADRIAAEIEVGRDLARELQRQLGVDRDPDLGRFLGEVGGRLLPCLKDESRPYAFEVVGGSEPNAMALPGGIVLITRSLLELVEYDVAEVAFVLGHELGHVVKHHALERLMTDTAITAAARALPSGRLGGKVLSSVATRLVSSAYSKERERVADRIGAALCRGAGFSPEAAISLLARLAKRSRERPLGQYFSTHPPFEDRIQGLSEFLRERWPSGVPLKASQSGK